jgi:hypothetical protein
MDMEKKELLMIIDALNSQVAQLNLDNIVLRTKIELLSKEKEEE